METNGVMEGPATRATFSLPLGLVEVIRERAAREDRPISWVARRALVEGLKDDDKEESENVEET